MSKIGKTYHVDFKKKEVLKVEQGEIQLPEPDFSQSSFSDSEAFDLFDLSNFFSPTVKPEPFRAMKEALRIDPAKYIEASIQRFEQILDHQGLFDETKYRNPDVLVDARRVYLILQREILMLRDVMDNLQSMIIKETGDQIEVDSAELEKTKKV